MNDAESEIRAKESQAHLGPGWRGLVMATHLAFHRQQIEKSSNC